MDEPKYSGRIRLPRIDLGPKNSLAGELPQINHTNSSRLTPEESEGNRDLLDKEQLIQETRIQARSLGFALARYPRQPLEATREWHENASPPTTKPETAEDALEEIVEQFTYATTNLKKMGIKDGEFPPDLLQYAEVTEGLKKFWESGNIPQENINVFGDEHTFCVELAPRLVGLPGLGGTSIEGLKEKIFGGTTE